MKLKLFKKYERLVFCSIASYIPYDSSSGFVMASIANLLFRTDEIPEARQEEETCDCKAVFSTLFARFYFVLKWIVIPISKAGKTSNSEIQK
jgi:hypothetical protein